ncbi:hypothetical protein I4U23_020111 [Adineta vaga]|nr:hypothetical protein I4U23_020111 [Adineta vaga]
MGTYKKSTTSTIHCLTVNIPLSSIVSVTSNSISSSHYSSNSTKVHRDEFRQGSSKRKPISINLENTITGISFRIRMRKLLNNRLALITNIMCLLGILGIILMIIENELIFNHIKHNDIRATWSIKLIISITTMMLLVLIFYYHYLDLKLYSIQNSLEDSRVGLTKAKIFLIASEIIICAIHPMPLLNLYSNIENISTNSTDYRSPSYTSVDVGLSLPMFFRLYLLGRSMMFHSYLFRNASLRSLSCLNQVTIDFSFLLKTYLEQWPVRCLLTLIIIAFLIGSWSLRACNYLSTGDHVPLSDSMWLFIVTFTTVGFGDIYPSTFCGRGITAIIGLFGLLSSALLITVLSQKLQLTREEKYIHTFVLNMQLSKDHQYQAANVVKFAIKVWYLKRQNKQTFMQSLQAQRQLYRSIHYLQQTKRQQGYLVDSCIGLHEVMTLQRNINTQYDETLQQMTQMKNDIRKTRKDLNNISKAMNNMQRIHL